MAEDYKKLYLDALAEMKSSDAVTSANARARLELARRKLPASVIAELDDAHAAREDAAVVPAKEAQATQENPFAGAKAGANRTFTPEEAAAISAYTNAGAVSATPAASAGGVGATALLRSCCRCA
jgi:hypothetical protein